MAGFGDPRMLDLMREIWSKPSFSVYQRVGKRLQELKRDLADRIGKRKVRLAILSSFTIDPIVPYLEVGCTERGIVADIYVSAFNQFAQQLVTPESDLYRFRPDIAYLHVMPDALVSGISAGELTPAQIGDIINALRGYIAAFRRESQGELVVSNFSAPVLFPYMIQNDEARQVTAELNRQLEKLAGEMPGVYVLDYESLTGFHGKGAIADHRLRHLARMEIGHEMFLGLARLMLAYVVALRGFGRKCVVLDLDNILWGGIVGEDGSSRIQLGSEYPGSAFVEFQKALLVLYRRGVLLAINSKNNHEDALAVLQDHPAMVLRPGDFAAIRINWKDKCENIEAISNELNLGLDSMVFIDDSPAERELMRRLRPEVLTPEWPPDPVMYSSALGELWDFASMSVTGEDRRRGEMYAAERKRSDLKDRSATLEDYLFGLKLGVLIGRAEGGDIPRVTQLFQRTNQFNLTTRRYSAAQVEEFVRGDKTLVYVLRNSDAFGDNGLIGVALVVKEMDGFGKAAWGIDSLLMSCRVLGRTIETFFLDYIITAARRDGVRYVIGEFIPTSKNEIARDFYAQAGFHLEDVGERGNRWVLDLSTYTSRTFPWLEIKAELASQL